MDATEQIKGYSDLSDQEVLQRIRARRANLGSRVMLLVHNYQRWEICELADQVGDSLELARLGRRHSEVPNVILCGVHFMAETVRILAAEGQRVFLPNRLAGCPMADMVSVEDAGAAWDVAAAAIAAAGRKLVPVTYVNSDAEMKAFTGRKCGVTCTSSNARRIFDHFLGKGYAVFFFPDEHLGRNTANAAGVPPNKILSWDRERPLEGLDPDAIGRADILLWKGYCHVHTYFRPEHVERARRDFPGCKVIVHPECPQEVVAAADASGSTRQISEYVKNAAPGDTIVIGTEINHVRNLAIRYPDRTVVELARSLCPNMFRINPRNLLYTIENMDAADEVTVPPDVAADARGAVERMLELS